MAIGSVTIRAVEALDVAAGQMFLWDNEVRGFGVKATPTTKTFIYQYRLGGRGAKTRRVTLGRFGSITPDMARKQAKKLASDILAGRDPAEVKRKAETDRINLAFRAYGKLFLERDVALKSERFHTLAEGILRLHAYPVLREKPLPEITKADIVDLFDRMPADKRALRRNAFAVLRRLFNWAVSRDDIHESPLRGFEAPPIVQSRDRVLLDAELALAWRASERLGYPFGPLFQLLMATGQRREEVAAMDWSELDRPRRLWILPKGRTKNAKAHSVHLNELAMAAIDAATKRTGAEARLWPRKGLIFTTTGETAVSGYSRAKARLDAEMLALAREAATAAGSDPNAVTIAPWRTHDARRTLATGLQRLGVRFEVTEAVLNHVSGSRSGVAAVYQRHEWTDEKRVALDSWGAHLRKIITSEISSNVVPIKASAGHMHFASA